MAGSQPPSTEHQHLKTSEAGAFLLTTTDTSDFGLRSPHLTLNSESFNVWRSELLKIRRKERREGYPSALESGGRAWGKWS
jgi:hypothetical protein